MEFQSVKSSALKEVGYGDGEIGVCFNNGSVFFYPGTEDEFEAMLAAESVGKHFLAHIKPRGGITVPRNTPPDREMPPPPMEEPLARHSQTPHRVQSGVQEALPEGLAADPGEDPDAFRRTV